jgi:ribosomal protein S18 acetylase RimI-like enzyme
MSPVDAIGLRPATPAGGEFLFGVHKAAMGVYVDSVWGWDDGVQREYHERAFGRGGWQVITADGADVGMLSVDYLPGEVYLGRIEIDPAHQGRGMATHLIGALLDEAARRGQDLVLDVLAVNTRAQALYRRLGLVEVARHGDGDIKIRMRATPPPPGRGS